MEVVGLCYVPATELVTVIKAKRVWAVEAVLARSERSRQGKWAMEAVAGTAAEEAEAAMMCGDCLGSLHDLPVSIEGLVTAKSEHTPEGVRDGSMG